MDADWRERISYQLKQSLSPLFFLSREEYELMLHCGSLSCFDSSRKGEGEGEGRSCLTEFQILNQRHRRATQLLCNSSVLGHGG